MNAIVNIYTKAGCTKLIKNNLRIFLVILQRKTLSLFQINADFPLNSHLRSNMHFMKRN